MWSKLPAIAADEQIDLFYSLLFNPWGDRANYAHPFPMIYFQMKTSPVVNMGKEYWDYPGNEKGTYEELIRFNDLFKFKQILPNMGFTGYTYFAIGIVDNQGGE
jgi:Type II restriction endonuclease, TdeIII